LKNKNGAKILVVDDNSVVRDVVSRMLSRLGHEVSSADSAEGDRLNDPEPVRPGALREIAHFLNRPRHTLP